MTRSQFVQAICARVPSLAQHNVEALVHDVFDAMTQALARGERIEIRGFGTFGVKARPARRGRNPRTGLEVKVPERRALSFTVGKELKGRLNPPAADTGLTRLVPAFAPTSGEASGELSSEAMAAAGPDWNG